uniref:Uncharacterized protein n=1 Tax=Meloidogyne enterolobii TaxID=390850 RepID=A0A6V7UQ90_MELEN|nr:unnamed protein product [Meloidogyne enterolobii]
MEKDYNQCVNKLEVDNNKNLTNIQNNFDQKIKLFQKEVTNKMEQKYKENYQSLELKILKIEEENKDKITNLEQIIKQKDEKIFEEEIKRQMIEIERDHYKHLLDIQDKCDQKIRQIQNEIKQIKTEIEANIEIIGQKNDEKYQQFETENKNKIENLKKIINEKEIIISTIGRDITRMDQIIQSLEIKIKQNEKEYLNKIEELEEDIQQKGEKINSLDIQNKKAEEINNEMNKKLDKIINEQKNLINFVFNPKYIQIKNKWKEIDDRYKCCEENCVNTNSPTGKCKKGNGFVEIINETDIKYNKCIEGKGQNMNAQLDAEIRLNKPKNDCILPLHFTIMKLKSKRKEMVIHRLVLEIQKNILHWEMVVGFSIFLLQILKLFHFKFLHFHGMMEIFLVVD